MLLIPEFQSGRQGKECEVSGNDCGGPGARDLEGSFWVTEVSLDVWNEIGVGISMATNCP
jgi:hypothetical protein